MTAQVNMPGHQHPITARPPAATADHWIKTPSNTFIFVWFASLLFAVCGSRTLVVCHTPATTDMSQPPPMICPIYCHSFIASLFTAGRQGHRQLQTLDKQCSSAVQQHEAHCWLPPSSVTPYGYPTSCLQATFFHYHTWWRT